MTKKKLNYIRLGIATFILFWVMLAYMSFYTGQVAALEVISGSMEPTIKVGDRLIVKNVSEEAKLERNSIITLGSPNDDGPDLVKRLVALPGDKLLMRNGQLFINGQPDRDSNGNPIHTAYAENFDKVLGPGEYYVLGDNRDSSYDSTEFGPIKRDLVHGVVMFRYYPWKDKGAVQ